MHRGTASQTEGSNALKRSAEAGGASDGQEGLSLDCCNCLKGIFALCVLVHHLYQHSGLFRASLVGTGLQALGYLSVACFFFLSGYGLYVSYIKKGETYIREFFKKKIVPFYIVILLLSVIYAAEGVALGQTYSVGILLKSLTFGGTVIGKGWYLQVQLLLYLCFWLTFRTVKNRRYGILWIYGECLLFCLIMYGLGYRSTWFESVFAFAAGMTWCELAARKRAPGNKVVALGCGMEFVLFCAVLFGSFLVKNSVAALILKMLSAVLFAVLIAAATKLIRVENGITRWLGRYSFEIYVCQGLPLVLFHSSKYNIYIKPIHLYFYRCDCNDRDGGFASSGHKKNICSSKKPLKNMEGAV